jgi:thiamine biosynthesis lipoprotein
MPRGGAPRRRVPLAFLAFLAAAAAAAALLVTRRVSEVDETRVLMDTFVTVRVRAGDRAAGRAALDAAFAEMGRAARALDWFDSTTAAGGPAGALASPGAPDASDLARVLEVALDVARASDGAFDPTVRPLTALWNFEGEPRVPPAESLAAACARVGHERLRVEGGRVIADDPGLRLDLGGVAKGYVVDRAIDVLRAAPGLRGGLVAAGGDIRAFGAGPRGGAWTIGLAHPRAPSEVAARFPLSDGAVSTSGDYQRAFTRDGIRYHHLLDPKTGMPARASVSATVFAPTGIEADALATAAFVLGPAAGKRLLAGRPGREAIWIVEREGDLAVERTPGLEGRIEIDLTAVRGAGRADARAESAAAATGGAP